MVKQYQSSIDQTLYHPNPKHEELFRSCCYKYFNRLRKFHALTLHLKCRNFDEGYKPYPICVCPIGRCGMNWVTHNNLNWLTNKNLYGGNMCSSCSEGSANTYANVSHHLQTVNKSYDVFGFHKYTLQYLKLCSDNLPAFTTWYLIMDETTPVILRVGEKLPTRVLDHNFMDDDLSDTESESDVKLPVKKKKLQVTKLPAGSGIGAEKPSPPYSRTSSRVKGTNQSTTKASTPTTLPKKIVPKPTVVRKPFPAPLKRLHDIKPIGGHNTSKKPVDGHKVFHELGRGRGGRGRGRTPNSHFNNRYPTKNDSYEGGTQNNTGFDTGWMEDRGYGKLNQSNNQWAYGSGWQQNHHHNNRNTDYRHGEQGQNYQHGNMARSENEFLDRRERRERHLRDNYEPQNYGNTHLKNYQSKKDEEKKLSSSTTHKPVAKIIVPSHTIKIPDELEVGKVDINRSGNVEISQEVFNKMLTNMCDNKRSYSKNPQFPNKRPFNHGRGTNKRQGRQKIESEKLEVRRKDVRRWKQVIGRC